jgi:hypothetical protein
VPFLADIYFAAVVVGLLLLCAEFCFPGLVVPAAAGSVLALGGAWRLFQLSHPFASIHTLVMAPLLLLMFMVVSVLLRVAAQGRASKRHLDLPHRFLP